MSSLEGSPFPTPGGFRFWEVAMASSSSRTRLSKGQEAKSFPIAGN